MAQAVRKPKEAWWRARAGSSSLKQRSDFGDVTGRLAKINRGEPAPELMQ